MNMAEFTGVLYFEQSDLVFKYLLLMFLHCIEAGVRRVFSILSRAQVQVWLQAVLESSEGRLWLQRVRPTSFLLTL